MQGKVAFAALIDHFGRALSAPNLRMPEGIGQASFRRWQRPLPVEEPGLKVGLARPRDGPAATARNLRARFRD